MGCRIHDKDTSTKVHAGTRVKNKFRTREEKIAERAAKAAKNKQFMARIRQNEN
jgi:hypothetical protein